MKKSIIAGWLLMLSMLFSGLVAAESQVEQKPFDSGELEKFIVDYSVMTKWQPTDNYYHGNLKDPWVMAGMQFNEEFAASLQEKGWSAPRFFYMLNHVRQGIVEEQDRQRQQEIETRMNNQMAAMAAKMSAQRDAFEKQRQEQNKRAKAWLADQLAAQKKQVRENVYMHPMQKKSILDFLDRSLSEVKFVDSPQLSAEEAQAKADAQRKAWAASYRQSIQNNPYIDHKQKQLILEGLDQANKPMVITQPVEMPTQKEMMAKIQEQRAAWIVKQIEQVTNNSGYSDEQRDRIIKRLQEFATQMSEPPSTKPSGTIPDVEKALVKENMGRLVELLSSN
ncbi:MAG: hypothetical protein HQL70_05335 [Magnetococcales bacterium]|nr:hypothetical protein [Magnetococcales bacterium]